MRYSKSDLIAAIDGANEELEEMGSDRRLEYGGRYGYKAVDERDVHETNGGIVGTVETGTSRECVAGVDRYVSAKYREHTANAARAKIQFAESVLSLLSGKATIRKVRQLAKSLQPA